MDEEYGDNSELMQSAEQKESADSTEKSISADLIRGHINTIILRSLSDGDKYGYEIIAEIEEKSKGQYSLKQPSLYSALKRLESQGYITSYWGGTVGGGRRKYFSLTDEGKTIADTNRAEWEYSRTIIDSLISDKDFDFNNPAPAAVNMRVLKDTTSRVPSREDEEEEVSEDVLKTIRELRAEKEEIENELRESKAREEILKAEAEENVQAVEEIRREYEQREAERREQEILEAKLREQQRAQQAEELTESDRERYEKQLKEKDAQLDEQRERYERELQEQETLFREREQEIMHQNFINLVNTPPAKDNKKKSPSDGEKAEEEQAESDERVRDYRSVVEGMYANSIRPDHDNSIKNDARSIGGIDFTDIEQRAKEDGIKIVTTAKSQQETRENSPSVVHRGKALFLSALIVFLLSVAEGAIVMGLRNTYVIPIALPCFMWGIPLVLLLATGLAYANHFGKNSLRRATPALVNTIVLYILAVIITLIVALGVNIDFTCPSALACFIAIPVVYLLGIMVFGVSYYLQIKPKK